MPRPTLSIQDAIETAERIYIDVVLLDTLVHVPVTRTFARTKLLPILVENRYDGGQWDKATYSAWSKDSYVFAWYYDPQQGNLYIGPIT